MCIVNALLESINQLQKILTIYLRLSFKWMQVRVIYDGLQVSGSMHTFKFHSQLPTLWLLWLMTLSVQMYILFTRV